MTTTEFLHDYNRFLKANFNAERAKKEKVYLYSDLKHYGISSPVSKIFFTKHKNYLASSQVFHKKSYWLDLKGNVFDKSKNSFTYLKENKSKMSGLSLREGSRRLPKDLRDKLNLVKSSKPLNT